MGRRRRQAFSTGTTAAVYRDAKRRRGFSHARAVAVHDALLDWLREQRVPVGAMRQGAAYTTTLEDLAVAELVPKFAVSGLFAWLGWTAAKFFAEWLIRRLIRAWAGAPSEFAMVMEDLDGGPAQAPEAVRL